MTSITRARISVSAFQRSSAFGKRWRRSELKRKNRPVMPTKETTISLDEISRAKRAVVVLTEAFAAANGGKQAPLALREDVQALMGLIRKIEKL
ncbi:MAG: hypothetical protein IPL32_18715 [Chloracidobacterium sp.]|nr:hypothetical protein [Chloracidobacterium sp.]